MNKYPKHVAIILDGNGRWAKKKSKPRSFGHKKGAENLEKLIEKIINTKIKYLTLYAFSDKNWGRPKNEVSYLMTLFKGFLDRFLDKYKDENVKIKFIGCRDKLDENLKNKMIEIEESTKNKKGLVVSLAINYGGRDEIVRAVNKILKEDIKNVSEKDFVKFLDTKSIPDPDIIVRTSGELRISGFLLWQLAYSELFFVNKMWPDFKFEDLKQVIYEYMNRERRMGKIKGR